MKSFIQIKTLILILIAITYAYTQTCPAITCNYFMSTQSDTSSTSGQSCYQQNSTSNSVSLNLCYNNFACVVSQSSASNTQLQTSSGSANLNDNTCVLQSCLQQNYPMNSQNLLNNRCYRNSDCATNLCNTAVGKCMMMGLGDPCTQGQNNCGPGLKCIQMNSITSNMYTCQRLLTSSKNCSFNSFGQNSWMLCPAGTYCIQLNQFPQPQCTKLFSVAGNQGFNQGYSNSINDVTVLTPIFGSSANTVSQQQLVIFWNNMCASGQFDVSLNLCMPQALITNSTNPSATSTQNVLCTSDSQCIPASISQAFQALYVPAKCLCQSATESGNAYCSGYIGDYPNQQIINSIRNSINNYLQTIAQSCAEYQYTLNSNICYLPSLQLPSFPISSAYPTGNFWNNQGYYAQFNVLNLNQMAFPLSPCLLNSGLGLIAGNSNDQFSASNTPSCPVYNCQSFNQNSNNQTTWALANYQNNSNNYGDSCYYKTTNTNNQITYFIRGCPPNYNCLAQTPSNPSQNSGQCPLQTAYSLFNLPTTGTNQPLFNSQGFLDIDQFDEQEQSSHKRILQTQSTLSFCYAQQGAVQINQFCFTGGTNSTTSNTVHSNDCQTNWCQQSTAFINYGTCSVLKQGETCSSSYQCGANMMCNYQQTCQPYITNGATCNYSSWDRCYQGYCIFQLNTINQQTVGSYQCVNYYSQPNGTQFQLVYGEGDGLNAASNTGNQNAFSYFPNNLTAQSQTFNGNQITSTSFNMVCQSDSFNTTTNQCNPYPERTNSFTPQICNSNSDCVSIYNNIGVCSCYPNTQGYKFCQPLTYDIVQNYNALQQKQQYYQQLNTQFLTQSKCNFAYMFRNGCQITLTATSQVNVSSPYQITPVPTSMTDICYNFGIFGYTYQQPSPSQLQCQSYQCNTGQLANGPWPQCLVPTNSQQAGINPTNLNQFNPLNVQQCYPNYKCVSKSMSFTNLNQINSESIVSGQFQLSDYEGYCLLDSCSSKLSSSQSCYRNSDCGSNICSGQSCSAQKVNQNCTMGADNCGTGLRCIQLSGNSQATCQQVLGIGAACTAQLATNSYFLCAYGTICLSQNGGQSTCTQPFTVANQVSITQTTLSNPQPLYNPSLQMMCNSYNINGNTCVQAFQTKGTTTQTNGTLPKTCSQNSDCEDTNGGQSASCICAVPTTNGQAYCSGNMGDSIVVAAVKSLNQTISTVVQAFASCAEYDYIMGTTNCEIPSTSVSYQQYPPISQALSSCVSSASFGLNGLQNFVNDASIFPQTNVTCPSYVCASNSNSAVQYGNNENGNYDQCAYTNVSSNTYILKQCPQNYVCGAAVQSTTSSCGVVTNNLNTLLSPPSTTSAFSAKQNYSCVVNGPLQGLIDYQGTCFGIGNVTLPQNSSTMMRHQGDCITKFCANTNSMNLGTCGYKTVNQVCTSDAQCGPGLICCNNQFSEKCYQSTCQAQYSIGTPCNQETYYLCQFNSLCVRKYNETQFTCQQRHTFGPGFSFSVIVNGQINTQPALFGWTQDLQFDSMCKGAVYNIQTLQCNPTWETTALPTGTQWPKTCNTDQDCMGTYGQPGKCQCFPTTQNQAYCKGFPGDYQVFVNNITNLQMQTMNYSTQCPFYKLRSQYGNVYPNDTCYINFQNLFSNFQYWSPNFTQTIAPYNCYNSSFMSFGWIKLAQAVQSQPITPPNNNTPVTPGNQTNNNQTNTTTTTTTFASNLSLYSFIVVLTLMSFLVIF